MVADSDCGSFCTFSFVIRGSLKFTADLIDGRHNKRIELFQAFDVDRHTHPPCIGTRAYRVDHLVVAACPHLSLDVYTAGSLASG